MNKHSFCISEIIAMAWCDKTPFDAISHSYGLTEAEVKQIMRKNLSSSAYRNWRKRVVNRPAKHTSKSCLKQLV